MTSSSSFFLSLDDRWQEGRDRDDCTTFINQAWHFSREDRLHNAAQRCRKLAPETRHPFPEHVICTWCNIFTIPVFRLATCNLCAKLASEIGFTVKRQWTGNLVKWRAAPHEGHRFRRCVTIPLFLLVNNSDYLRLRSRCMIVPYCAGRGSAAQRQIRRWHARSAVDVCVRCVRLQQQQ